MFNLPNKKLGLINSKLGDEFLVTDIQSNRCYLLDKTSSIVWSCCDGKTSLAEAVMAIRRESCLEEDSEAAALSALHELEELNLLECCPPQLSRRQLIQGLGALVPVVTSIALVSPASATSVGSPTVDSITVNTATPMIDCPLSVTVTATAPPGCPIVSYDWDISSSIAAGETFDFTTAGPMLNQTASSALFSGGAGSYFLVVRANTATNSGSNAIMYTIDPPGLC